MKYLPVLQSVKENENHYCDQNHLNFKKSKKVAKIIINKQQSSVSCSTQRNMVKCKTWIIHFTEK